MLLVDRIWKCVVRVWGFVEGFGFLLCVVKWWFDDGNSVVSVFSGLFFFFGFMVENWFGY